MKKETLKKNRQSGEIFTKAAFKRLKRLFPENLNKRKWWNSALTMYTDGAPITESTANSIWPVMFKANNLGPEGDKPYNIMYGGFWVDSCEPDFQVFLTPIIEELRQMYKVGQKVVIEGEQYQSFTYLLLVCGDTPAKLKMLGLYNFNNYIGACNACGQKPSSLTKRTGTKKAVYPFRKNVPQYTQKSDMPQWKFKYKSPLIELLEYFDPVSQCPCDPMHT
jgi:hypothetical protein